MASIDSAKDNMQTDADEARNRRNQIKPADSDDSDGPFKKGSSADDSDASDRESSPKHTVSAQPIASLSGSAPHSVAQCLIHCFMMLCHTHCLTVALTLRTASLTASLSH